MNIYVGNLPRQATEDDLRSAFEPFGKVMSANVIRSRDPPAARVPLRPSGPRRSFASPSPSCG